MLSFWKVIRGRVYSYCEYLGKAGVEVTFAVQVCRNCDARFSCSAYRRYVKSSSSQADSLLSRFLNDYGSDSEREDFLYGNLENIPDVESFDI